MKETIGNFFGKPISTMNRKELLELVKFFSKEDQKKEKRIQELEDENIKYLFGVKLNKTKGGIMIKLIKLPPGKEKYITWRGKKYIKLKYIKLKYKLLRMLVLKSVLFLWVNNIRWKWLQRFQYRILKVSKVPWYYNFFVMPREKGNWKEC